MKDEYIRKQDAIDRMNCYGSIWMEYTEGMSKHEVAEQALKASKQAVIDVLKNLPSADVAPVVRCKDCYHNNDCDIQYSAQAGDSFFCGFGETEKDVREDIYE